MHYLEQEYGRRREQRLVWIALICNCYTIMELFSFCVYPHCLFIPYGVLRKKIKRQNWQLLLECWLRVLQSRICSICLSKIWSLFLQETCYMWHFPSGRRWNAQMWNKMAESLTEYTDGSIGGYSFFLGDRRRLQ